MSLKDLLHFRKRSSTDATNGDASASSSQGPFSMIGSDVMLGIVKNNILLSVLITVFTVAYIAVGYQCEQDDLTIKDLEKAVVDARLRVVSSHSDLTRLSRRSSLIERMAEYGDTCLNQRDSPFIIRVEEQ